MQRSDNMEPLFRFLTVDDDKISAICGFADRYKEILNHRDRPTYGSAPISSKNSDVIRKPQVLVKSAPVEIVNPVIKKIHQTTITQTTGTAKKLPTITPKLEIKSLALLPAPQSPPSSSAATSTLEQTLEKLLETQTEQTQLLRTMVEQNSRLLDQNRKFLKTLKIVDE